MNFYDYIGMSPEHFATEYLDTDLIMVNEHESFPLNIYNYTRKCVQEQVWDSVTSKCRGVIVNRNTGEIVARPFEKFHNYGSPQPFTGQDVGFVDGKGYTEPVIWEKLDGFMCTLYEWEGVHYLASKGSFHSTHAKWATARFRKQWGTSSILQKGWTAVFEGICPELRIVVNYGDVNELRLLAVINNETGEEYRPSQIKALGEATGFSTPELHDMTLEEARHNTLIDDLQVTDNGNIEGKITNEEGYVLTWYRDGITPFRLKMKFIDYLRLHRMVTNVSPKHIWEVLSNGLTSEMEEYIKNSTPWFARFAQKWARALTTEYQRLEYEANKRYAFSGVNPNDYLHPFGTMPVDFHGLRKAYATEFMKPENKEFSGILFAMLDGKDVKPIIWKMVKPMTKDKNPLVNGFSY